MSRSIARAGTYPQDLMEVTAEPLREECLKGLLNGEAVSALVRGQVSPGDERIESCLRHANLRHLNPSWLLAPHPLQVRARYNQLQPLLVTMSDRELLHARR